MKKLTVELSDNRDYPVQIGHNILNSARDLIRPYSKAKRFLVVSNQKIYNLYSSRLKLDNARFCLINDGEIYKNLDTFNKIIDKAVDMNLERNDAIIAFGGGVIGDIAGFAAQSYMRGVDFIQIPTTLLAQVDSSIGGKVAINHAKGKNLIGAFYQPKIVISDVSLLDTLDERQIKTGLGEVLKYALIENSIGHKEFFGFLSFLLRNERDFYRIVETSVALKSEVVSKDEKEGGLRAILNFGHTFAHAIETYTNYKLYTHGEAVTLGMRMALKLSLSLGLIDENYYNLCAGLFETWNMNVEFEANPSEMFKIMKHDKKVIGGSIRLVLAEGYQKVGIYQDIDEGLIKKAMIL